MAFFENRKIVGYIVLALIIFGFYDVLLHFIFIIAHSIFEWLELGLEKLIEHLFDTTRKQSQLIVFYLLLSAILVMLYRLWLCVPLWLFQLKEYLLKSWLYYRKQFLIYYKKQSLIKKIKILMAFFGVSFVVYFAVS